MAVITLYEEFNAKCRNAYEDFDIAEYRTSYETGEKAGLVGDDGEVILGFKYSYISRPVVYAKPKKGRIYVQFVVIDDKTKESNIFDLYDRKMLIASKNVYNIKPGDDGTYILNSYDGTFIAAISCDGEVLVGEL